MGSLGRHQKRILLFLVTGLQVGVLGCSSVHQSQGSDDSPENLKKQILELQKLQSQQTSQIEDLNNKITMLSASHPQKDPVPAKDVTPPPPRPSTPILTEPAEKVNPLAPVAAPADVPIQKSSKDPAFKLYAQVVAECKKPKLDDAQKTVAVMIKKFKDSPVTSNALYLYADTLYERENYAKSADEFERLYKLFPDGNKAVSALYRLALCYQRLGHPAEAQQAFENIVTLYPGSREALDSEKQIMNGQEIPQ